MTKVIFENDFIKVTATGRDYDFIATVENKTSKEICVHYDEPRFGDNYDPIVIKPNDWVGLLTNDEGRDWIVAFEKDWFCITDNSDENELMVFRSDLQDARNYVTGCSMTQWNEDCKEITNEVERILNEYNLCDHDRNTNVANSNQLVTVLEILKNIK